MATEDFDNDRKDAGEIGAGHSVTAIYEIVPVAENAADVVSISKALKYQSAAAGAPEQKPVHKAVNLSPAAKSGELATLALRFKKPDANKSQRIEFAVKNVDKSFESASSDFRFAASVAGFGMLLRGSEYSGDATAATIEKMATNAIGDDASGYRAEFVDLIRKAGQISDRR